MDAGNCDAVVSSVSITDERKQNMDFTEPYYDSDQSLMVLKENQADLQDPGRPGRQEHRRAVRHHG